MLVWWLRFCSHCVSLNNWVLLSTIFVVLVLLGDCFYRLGGGRSRFRRFSIVPGTPNSVQGLLDKVIQDFKVEDAECFSILEGGDLADPPQTLSVGDRFEVNPKCMMMYTSINQFHYVAATPRAFT